MYYVDGTQERPSTLVRKMYGTSNAKLDLEGISRVLTTVTPPHPRTLTSPDHAAPAQQDRRVGSGVLKLQQAVKQLLHGTHLTTL